MGILRVFSEWRRKRRDIEEKRKRDYDAIHELWVSAEEMSASEFLAAMDKLRSDDVDRNAHTGWYDLVDWEYGHKNDQYY